MTTTIEVTDDPITVTLTVTSVSAVASGTEISVAVTDSQVDVTATNTQSNVTCQSSDSVVVSANPTITVVSATEQGPQGPAGPSGSTAVSQALVEVQWASPSSEAANTIEITGSILDFDGTAFSTSIADIEIVVTDGATDGEPSSTAYLTAASSPVGTILSGSSTATMVIRSAAGAIKVAVHETLAAHRYLWIRGAGHERLWVRAKDGVQELVFA